MKCNDCGNLGWGDDEGEIVYAWCRVRQYCPDLGIERDCSSFLKKRPDALSTLQTENEKLRAELEQVKRTLAMMWFAYVNSDKEDPHNYETEALEEAERLLGPWKECMPKYLRRGQKED